MEYLKVAKLLKAQGLKGEVRVYTTSSFKDLRYKKNNKLYIQLNPDNNEELKEVTIKSFKNKEGNIDILSFNEINDVNEIEKYLNKDLLVIKDEKILDKNMYFFSDLIGLKAYSNDNKEKVIGEIIDVKEFNSNISLILKLNEEYKNKTINIPFNDYFVLDIDLINKSIFINVIEGLLDI